MPSSEKHIVLLNKQNETTSGLLELNQYKIGYFISRCPGRQSDNEDALFIYSDPTILSFGVSDGAGGHPKGAEASSIATETIVDCLSQYGAKTNFLQMIEAVNQKVLDLKVGAHSTLCFGYIEDSRFSCHNVGDSEVIYWNSIGNEVYSNIPHSSVGYLIEAGAIDQSESLNDPERHFVSSLIGDPAVRIESASRMEVKKGHSILIGSDGVFDNVSHEELREILTKGSFENSFETLRDICLKQEAESWKKIDDISFVYVRKNFS